MIQNHARPRAERQPERTGIAQHQRPKATSNAFAAAKPTARSLLIRLLTNRAGANTSYSFVTYSSTECAAWARTRSRNTSWLLLSTGLCSMPGVVLFYSDCALHPILPDELLPDGESPSP